MEKREVKIGQTDYSVLILIKDTAFAPKTGLTNLSAGIDVCYTRVETDNDVVLVAGAPVALASPALTDPHLDWGFLEVDATNAPGLYRLDLPDAVFATGAWMAFVSLIATGCTPTHIEFILIPALPYDGVKLSAAGVDDIWDETITGHMVANSAGQYFNALIARVAQCGDAGSVSTIDLDAAAAAVNDFYKGQLIAIVYGTGVGQARACTAYDGATKIATINPDWATSPDGDSWFVIFNTGSSIVSSIDDDALAQIQAEMEENGASILDTIRDKLPSRSYLAGSTVTTGAVVDTVVLAEGSSDAVIADAVWNALTATYGIVAGNFGYILKAIIAAAVESAMFTGTPSDAELATLALYELGQEGITNFDDGTKRSILCKFFYPIIRDAVLRAYPWNFAIEYQTLAQEVAAPLYGYTYSYALPTDPYCLRALDMEETENDATFKIKGRHLYTDEGTVKLRYIARITNSGLYDSLFREALIARLAATLAYSVTRDKVLAQAQWALYEAKLREARTMDGMEGTVDEYESDDLTSVR